MAEATARTSYGRLVALLAARCRDLAAAEDALADAFAIALRTWLERGVPDHPEAWLLTTARRRLGHGARHRRVGADALPTLLLMAEEMAAEPQDFPDERLALLFICAHPAIDEAARSPLMLQAVLGLDAARIAAAFLVSPATMGQRLVRAKTRIRDAGIPFAVPERAELPERLGAVMDAIYAAYGRGWDDVDGADPRLRDLGQEAVRLARILTGLMPHEPEPKGLLALLLHCEARSDARRAADGAFVPLDAQDTERWSPALIDEAERLLAEAAGLARIGRFQLEAAIHSAHAVRAHGGLVDRRAVALLHEALVEVAPTVGILVARAVAASEIRGPEHGVRLLDELPDDAVRSYQPYWVARAHLLRKAGHATAHGIALTRALGLTEDPALRRFLSEVAERRRAD